MFKTKKIKQEESGFTLVELAIVMIIIGLLIGGILKGQELVHNSKLTTTAKELKSYSSALYAFQDKYSAVPGDLLNADSRLPDCNVTNSCQGGDGNRIIGTPTFTWLNNVANIDAENMQFWKHLSLSNFVNGVDVTAGNANLIDGLPESSINGYYDVVYGLDRGNGDPGALIGPYIRMTTCIDCPNLETNIGSQALTPLEAAFIDRKLDDGSPNTGSVRSISNGRGTAGGCEGLSHDETSDVRRCVLLMSLDY